MIWTIPDAGAEPAPPKFMSGRFRLAFLRKFVSFLIPCVVFALAFSTGGAFFEPDWALHDPNVVAAKAKARPVRLLSEYLRLDTVNPPGNEQLGTKFLAEVLRAEGIASEEICPEPTRCSLVARVEGTDPRGGLLLLHHIDVAPVDQPGWVFSPFEGSLREGYLCGRGAIDDKSLGIAFLEAFIAVHRSGAAPRRTLVFLADADEESASQRLGVQWLLEARPDLFRGVDYALAEGGVNETLDAKIQYFGVEVGHPSVQRFQLGASERGALESLGRRLEARQAPWRVSGAAREFMSRVGMVRRAAWRERVDELDRALLDEAWVKTLPWAYQVLLRTYAHVGPIEDREGDGYRREVVLVTPAGQDPEPDVAWFKGEVDRIGGAVRIDEESRQRISPISPFGTPLTEVLAEEIRKEHPQTPVGPYVHPLTLTTSKYLRERGIMAYGLSAFQVTIQDAFGIHGPNEKVRVLWFLDGVDLLTRVVTRFVGLIPDKTERFEEEPDRQKLGE